MKRMRGTPRPNLQQRARENDFPLHGPDGATYWDESAWYAFTLQEIEEKLETPTAEFAALCLELVDKVVRDERCLTQLRIPKHAWQLIADSWKRRDLSLYGRFDFSYDGIRPAKLLEYNADTPTSLFESAVFQWYWLEDCLAQGLLPAGADQFNSAHERLIARWRDVAKGSFVHLACMMDHDDDAGTIAYLEDCARQAGLASQRMDMGDIGLGRDDRFVDRQGLRINLLFKLYPWEWMFADQFGQSRAMNAVRFVEPPWKAILSNKGILPLLWQMAPGHPNLLPAYFEDDSMIAELGGSYARKPIYSREGQNIELVWRGETIGRVDGTYGAEGYIRQALAKLPDFDGNFPVLGCWLVGSEPSGMGIRESRAPLTTEAARFVPHAIID